jgi:transposase
MNDNVKVLLKGFVSPNSTQEAEKLLEKLFTLFSDNNFEIGMETTGHYWLALFSFLHEQGFLIHPEGVSKCSPEFGL